MIKNKRTFSTIFLISFFAAAISNFDSAKANTREQIKRMVIEEAQRNGVVPPSLALAVAKVESNFDEGAMSSAGARGVMQIMPKTARGEYDISANKLWDPRLNIRLGIDYLNKLYNQYGKRWSLALSHYNGGTLKGRGRAAIPHSYNRAYVTSVLDWSNRYEGTLTTAVLASTVDSRANPSNSISTMIDTATPSKSWQRHPKIANSRLYSRDNGNIKLFKAARNYQGAEIGQGWIPVDGAASRPSDRFQVRVDMLRRKFRESLRWNRTL